MNATRMLSHIIIALLVALGIFVALWTHSAQASGVVGPGCGDTSLRAAMAGGGSVTFNCGPAALIVIFSQLVITQSTTVDGGGAAITLYGDDGTRLFYVSSGVTLTLRNLTLSHAYSNASDGGAISNDGTLYLENSRIEGSSTDINHSGGALFSSGPVFITNSTFSANYGGSAGAVFINAANARAQISHSTFRDNQALNNSVGRGGGAIWVGPDAHLTVVDSQFISNTSKFVGGALFVSQGGAATVTTQDPLSRTTFIGNVVTGSIPSSLGGSGGAILSEGVLNVANVTFSRNEAGTYQGYGGAIRALFGSLDVSASEFDGNRANQVGGAISIQVPARITGSSFTRNSAQSGGAIYQLPNAALTIGSSTLMSNNATFGGALFSSGPLTLTHVTVSGNTAEGDGGGILSLGALDLNNSAVISNTAGRDGGGIHISSSAAGLTNLTLSGNSAVGDGGGIYVPQFSSAVVDLNNVTITRNTADSDNDTTGDGGGIRVVSGTLTVRNSIIAGNFDSPNSAGGGFFNPDCSGTLVSQRYNLVGMSNGCAGFTNGVNGDKVGTAGSPLDPLLGPLANNGGTTWTHALLPGSPAFNAGNPLVPGSGGFACAATDQRGVKRPLGPFCDMGAFEAGGVLLLPLIRR